MKLRNAWSHFLTITLHKLIVMKLCFRVGLYRQGLLHDLSKYTPIEFLNGARYYQGDRSPNAAERMERGYSAAWLHHKGRNPHHYEYWIQVNQKTGEWEGVKMPLRYVLEMVCDRIAASKVYNRGSGSTKKSAFILRRGRSLSSFLPCWQSRAKTAPLLTCGSFLRATGTVRSAFVSALKKHLL